MSVNNVRHMTWICHLPTLDHTSTHNLGRHAGFQVIPTLRRSFTSETIDRGDPQIYPYSFLRTRVDQWIFYSIYVCSAHMEWKTKVGPISPHYSHRLTRT